MRDWFRQAADMVEEQIVGRGVQDVRICKVMSSVPRHLFVPRQHQKSAYTDRPLPIGEQQTISQPYIVAKMTELLALEPGMKVLEIGTGSGYQAAILASLGARVWSVERVESLAVQANNRLDAMNLSVAILHGDGRGGYLPGAPYDRILVTAGAPRIESSWDRQLVTNGLLLVPVDVMTGNQRLLVRENLERGFRNTWYDYCRFVPLLTGVVQDSHYTDDIEANDTEADEAAYESREPRTEETPKKQDAPHDADASFNSSSDLSSDLPFAAGGAGCH